MTHVCTLVKAQGRDPTESLCCSQVFPSVWPTVTVLACSLKHLLLSENWKETVYLSPVAVARLTVTSVKLTCPTEIQKIKALSNFRISTCTQFPQRSVV